MLPIVAATLARQLDASCYVCVNTLDSYLNREAFLVPYLEALGRLSLPGARVWHDAEHRDVLHRQLRILWDQGFLREQVRPVLRCPCGRVEMLANAMAHRGARLYTLDAKGELSCECGSARLQRAEPVLVLTFPPDLEVPAVFPKLMENEVRELMRRMAGMDYLVSRTRQTGIPFQGSERSHWVDVDFFWLNHLACFPAAERIVVGSNHVPWHLCVAHALNRMADSDRAEHCLVLTPYVYDKHDFFSRERFDQLPADGISHSLYYLLSLQWGRQSSNWSPDEYRWVQRLEPTARSAFRRWWEHVPPAEPSVGLREAVTAAGQRVRPTAIKAVLRTLLQPPVTDSIA